MQTILRCAQRALGEWTRPYCLRSWRLLMSVGRRARPLLLAVAVVATTVIAAGNSATDKLIAPLAPPFHPSPRGAEATSMPWTVEVPMHPPAAPEVVWPDPHFRDLPDLVSAGPGDERSATGGQGAPHAESTLPGGDTAPWLLLGALLSAVTAIVLRRTLTRREPVGDPSDVGLALLEPEQHHASEPEPEIPAGPRTLDSRDGAAASDAVPSAAAADLAPAAATRAAPARSVAPQTPAADAPAPPPTRDDAPLSHQPGGSSDGGTRREDSASRVVLFERRPGTPWGR
jgi:hypothetical protein